MNLPVKIKNVLQNFELVSSRISRLGGRNFQYKKSDGAMVYLKYGVGIAAESLVREYFALQWLEKKQINVPRIIAFYRNGKNGKTYLVLSGINGTAAHQAKHLSRDEILHLTAKALKKFHSIKFTKSNNLRTLDMDLEHIRNCITLDVLKRRNFKAANEGKSPEEIFAYLLQMKHQFETSVFVHGDFCFPNIILSKNDYGFIDVGDSGPGDPYKDLSALEISITRNFGKEYIEVFYKYYDKNMKVDQLKIKYYQLIDQFGYHLNIEKYAKLTANSQKSE